MEQFKGTPGPFYAEQPAMGFSAIRSERDKSLVFAVAYPSAKYGDVEVGEEAKYADLALLAASWDLLQALILAEEGLTNAYDVDVPCHPNTKAGVALAKTRAAIAKALCAANVDGVASVQERTRP